MKTPFEILLETISVIQEPTVDLLYEALAGNALLREAYLRSCLQRDLRHYRRKQRDAVRPRPNPSATESSVAGDPPSPLDLVSTISEHDAAQTEIVPATLPPDQVFRRWFLRNQWNEHVPILAWTKRELREARARCLAVGNAGYHAAQFLQGLHDALEDGQIVHDKFTRDQLIALWQSLTVEAKVVNASIDRGRYRGILAELAAEREAALAERSRE